MWVPLQAHRRRMVRTVSFQRRCRTMRCSLDVNEQIASWFAGTERMHGYQSHQVVGRHVSLLNAVENQPHADQKTAASDPPANGHFGTEGLQVKKDGSQFWGNVITM